MIFIKYLIAFIVGIFFITFIFPVLSTFTDVVLTWLESLKCKTSLKITQYSKQIQQIQEEMIPTQTHTIGFAINDEGEYEEDD